MLLILLKTVGVAVGVAAVLLTISWRLWDRHGDVSFAGNTGSAVTFVLAYGAGFVLVNGSVPSFPPAETVNWLPYLAVLAAVIGIVHLFRSGPWWVRWGLRLVLVRLSFWLTMAPLIEHHWTGPESTLRAWGWDLSVLLLWWGVEKLEERMHGVVVPFLFLFSGTVASFLLISQIDYASMALYLGVYCGVLGVYCVATVWKPGVSIARGTLPAVVLLLPLMLVAGSGFSSGSFPGRWAFLLLGFVPLTGWVGCLPLFASEEGGEMNLIGPVAGSLLAILLFCVPLYQSTLPADPGTNAPGTRQQDDSGDTGDPYGDDYGYD